MTERPNAVDAVPFYDPGATRASYRRARLGWSVVAVLATALAAGGLMAILQKTGVVEPSKLFDSNWKLIGLASGASAGLVSICAVAYTLLEPRCARAVLKTTPGAIELAAMLQDASQEALQDVVAAIANPAIQILSAARQDAARELIQRLAPILSQKDPAAAAYAVSQLDPITRHILGLSPSEDLDKLLAEIPSRLLAVARVAQLLEGLEAADVNKLREGLTQAKLSADYLVKPQTLSPALAAMAPLLRRPEYLQQAELYAGQAAPWLRIPQEIGLLCQAMSAGHGPTAERKFLCWQAAYQVVSAFLRQGTAILEEGKLTETVKNEIMFRASDLLMARQQDLSDEEGIEIETMLQGTFAQDLSELSSDTYPDGFGGSQKTPQQFVRDMNRSGRDLDFGFTQIATGSDAPLVFAHKTIFAALGKANAEWVAPVEALCTQTIANTLYMATAEVAGSEAGRTFVGDREARPGSTSIRVVPHKRDDGLVQSVQFVVTMRPDLGYTPTEGGFPYSGVPLGRSWEIRQEAALTKEGSGFVVRLGARTVSGIL